jgi:hypothetical protein
MRNKSQSDIFLDLPIPDGDGEPYPSARFAAYETIMDGCALLGDQHLGRESYQQLVYRVEQRFLYFLTTYTEE